MLYHLPGGSDVGWSLPWVSYPRSPIVLQCVSNLEKSTPQQVSEPNILLYFQKVLTGLGIYVNIFFYVILKRPMLKIRVMDWQLIEDAVQAI